MAKKYKICRRNKTFAEETRNLAKKQAIWQRNKQFGKEAREQSTGGSVECLRSCVGSSWAQKGGQRREVDICIIFRVHLHHGDKWQLLLEVSLEVPERCALSDD